MVSGTGAGLAVVCLGLVGLVLHWTVAEKHRGWVLAGVGLVTLGPLAPAPVVGAAVLTAVLWTAMGKAPTGRVTVAAVVGLLGALAAVKCAVALGVSVRGHPLWMPLGASFLCFRLVDWVLARRRGRLGQQPLGDVLGWILMPALFTAGPIEGLEHHLRNRSPRLTRQHVVEGLQRIAVGLGKKLVLADLVVSTLLARWGLEAPEVRDGLQASVLTVGQVWCFAGLSFLHLYLDFSGYSDLAIGIGRLFGLRVTENFRYPLLARDPADFWRRWHVSLADWCRTHVYMPALGVTRSPYAAALLTFVVMGVWHAPALPWVLWGVWHGLLLCGVQRWRRARRGRPPLPAWTAVVGVPLTLAGAVLGHALAALHGVGGVWMGPALFLRMVGLYLPWVPV